MALVGLVLVLAAGAAYGWWGWLPHWRPALRSGEVYGVDVSEHQGEIDWTRVAAAQVRFAYVKATEGADYTDSRFAASWRGVRRRRCAPRRLPLLHALPAGSAAGGSRAGRRTA